MKAASRPAYLMWVFSAILAGLAFAASGLVAGLPPDPGHRGFVIFASFAIGTAVVGYGLFRFPRTRLRVRHVTVERDGATFTVVGGAIEAVRWPAAGSGSDSRHSSIRLADWSAVPKIADQDRYTVVYRRPDKKWRVAPLTPEAFAAIRESWRAFGCRVTEDARPPEGREGMITFLSV